MQDGVQHGVGGRLRAAPQPFHGRLRQGCHRLVSAAEGTAGGEGGLQVAGHQSRPFFVTKAIKTMQSYTSKNIYCLFQWCFHFFISSNYVI